MEKRVVITGMGCITPLGNEIESTWKNILEGVSGVGYITQFEAEGFKTKISAEVKGFDAEELFGKKESRKIDRFAQFAMASALQALTDANLEITEEIQDRVGVLVGSGIGGMGSLNEQLTIYNEKGPLRISPFLVPMMIPDSASGVIAIKTGAMGPNMAVSTACATGTNALGEAFEIIRGGRADVMIAGGSESAIIPIAMGGLNSMGAMSTRNDEPQSASRPFDKNRDGFVMGEGAAVLILEELEFALNRGARILSEFSGYGTTNDAFHISAPAENGIGSAKCMRLALNDAGLTEEGIEYINAHGTSTYLNDRSETAAIKTVFGEHAYQIPVSSTKSMTGHLLGASGAVEAMFCVLALRDQIIPPTINHEVFDPECDLDFVPNEARKATLNHVMSNSFGFGGHNASIVLSRFTSI
jgi:3-oxoacyl-[acyl-carrier-protein] synthase II